VLDDCLTAYRSPTLQPVVVEDNQWQAIPDLNSTG